MSIVYNMSDCYVLYRIQKGVSAREMSLSLGQSTGYINNIENKNSLPSMNRTSKDGQ